MSASIISSAAVVREFSALVEQGVERVFVAEHPIDLRRLNRPNEVYVVEFSGPASNGGGPRSPSRAYHYRCGTGALVKAAEYDDRENLESLDVPPSSSVTHVALEDGREVVVRGVVDRELVSSFREYLAL